MTAVVALLLAASACDDVSAAADRLRAAQTDGELSVALAELRSHVPVSLLTADEEELPRDRRALLAAGRVASACALLRSAPPSVSSDRAALKAILDAPEFVHARDRNADALGQFLRRVREWLMSFLEERTAQTFSQSVRFVVLGLAFALGVAALLRLARGRWRSRNAAAPTATDALPLLDPAVHLKRAKALLSRSPRDALREGLLALLSELERRRLARPDRVKTNRELSRELPARGASAELSQSIGALLEIYDRTFYSLRDVQEDEAARFIDAVGAVRTTLEAR